jgi:hypothetical protein
MEYDCGHNNAVIGLWREFIKKTEVIYKVDCKEESSLLGCGAV